MPSPTVLALSGFGSGHQHLKTRGKLSTQLVTGKLRRGGSREGPTCAPVWGEALPDQKPALQEPPAEVSPPVEQLQFLQTERSSPDHKAWNLPSEENEQGHNKPLILNIVTKMGYSESFTRVVFIADVWFANSQVEWVLVPDVTLGVVSLEQSNKPEVDRDGRRRDSEANERVATEASRVAMEDREAKNTFVVLMDLVKEEGMFTL
ncbi:hypothetical protein B566_EDAN012627 [Ephemera danica]|nr:hypothetical protein B566_EDAN012627 [Ephemera danica]